MKYKKEKAKTKQERNQIKKANVAIQQKGEGLFLFKNRSSFASLELPKKSNDGKKWVNANETWQGDSYFLKMVPREAILVKTLISPQQKEEKMLNEENKLILDQPDQITNEGKVEHVVSSVEEQQINEQAPAKKNKSESKKKSKETLLTEDPLSGVTIIRD